MERDTRALPYAQRLDSHHARVVEHVDSVKAEVGPDTSAGITSTVVVGREVDGLLEVVVAVLDHVREEALVMARVSLLPFDDYAFAVVLLLHQQSQVQAR